MIAEGSDRAEVAAVQKAVGKDGGKCKIVASKVGGAKMQDGTVLKPDCQLAGDALGSFGPAKAKLDEISKILGLTGKPEGVDGSEVEAMVLAGQIEEVARYCESDVLNTYRVWLVYELFRGSITAKD